MKNDGGPAFPTNIKNPEIFDGMTLRDYFAAAYVSHVASIAVMVNPDSLAIQAYAVADAMIVQRDKEGK